jgi:hypothetical protein
MIISATLINNNTTLPKQIIGELRVKFLWFYQLYFLVFTYIGSSLEFYLLQ